MELTCIQTAPTAPSPNSYRADGGFLNPANSRPLSIRLSPEARERHRHREEGELSFLDALGENFAS